MSLWANLSASLFKTCEQLPTEDVLVVLRARSAQASRLRHPVIQREAKSVSEKRRYGDNGISTALMPLITMFDFASGRE